MGYCHYYSYKLSDPDFDRTWPTIVEDVLRIIARVKEAGIGLSHTFEGGGPRYSGIELFAVNGDPDNEDLLSEHLVIFRQMPPNHWKPPQDGWLASIVKTSRMPYDLAVAAILLRCKMLLPAAFAVHSDGAWDEEWLYGATGPIPGGLGARAIVADLFGDTPAQCPFERERALLISH